MIQDVAVIHPRADAVVETDDEPHGLA